ncbi:HNH endonuclease [Yersinia enterocolitica]|uniref:HNH endonuclease signature motif containing protein n=1 Tax=Yersinia enterocolitica TaxID=630 RepID=UPI00285B328C|nr:HNH endonuclease [Yersinia enterocolitica]ELI8407630.1 HNH endonuclease [Yersinia enterocolitica]HDM8309780.1 HNH endonuclease [Yersinia enterocolitica]HDV7143373.1 HNH endonuclease [Yersinia enterocolitica]HDY3769831.1 HNH endonuclease [Yersinia enterocolitica]
MTKKFRIQAPTRTCQKTYKIYGRYKPYLASDFYNRCGYTDCPDFWFGGTGNFHIDHFIPWKKHPTQPNLQTDYSNLVYCCSYVNILKSDDETSYLDPCNVDYNNHFFRDEFGNIQPNKSSREAMYMYKKLKLYMKRYQIIWMLENLFNKMDQVKEAIKISPDGPQKDELKHAMSDLACVMLDYKNYLSESQ